MSVELIAYPDWTEYKKKSGLDPLGMQNSSINLYQRLLPGISNVTLRVRYYGFYAWLASIYAHRIGDTNPKTWQKFVRRAEAVYALAAQRRGNEAGMAGVQWAQRKLDADEQPVVEFSRDADPGGDGTPYLQQPWGVYGAAYGSQLITIGIYAAVKGHQIPVPSPEFGEALALAFEDAAGPLADRLFEAVQRGFVSRTDLDDFSVLTPSGIHVEGGERQLYEDVLFAKGALSRPDDLYRRQTLLLLLHVVSHLGRTPNVMETRWLLYAGADNKNQQFKIDAPAREEQRRRWWVYQANDLLHYSYETLLKYTLDTLEDYPTGIALNTLIAELVSALSEPDHNWPLTWRDFLAAQPPAQNANGNTPSSARSFVEAIAPTSGLNHRTTPEAAWAALRLLAVVVNRAHAESVIIDAALGHLDREGFHSLVTEIDFLTACQDQPFPRTVDRIIEERIVKRHLWVAHRKFRYQNDYTFLIEADDGRVRLRAGNGPVLTNPRLATAITFLEDIHLIDAHGVTARGESLLEAL
jgi:hypothetical protein